MRAAHAVCPEHVPRVLAYDDGARLLVMEHVGPPLTKVSSSSTSSSSTTSPPRSL